MNSKELLDYIIELSKDRVVVIGYFDLDIYDNCSFVRKDSLYFDVNLGIIYNDKEIEELLKEEIIDIDISNLKKGGSYQFKGVLLYEKEDYREYLYFDYIEFELIHTHEQAERQYKIDNILYGKLDLDSDFFTTLDGK